VSLSLWRVIRLITPKDKILQSFKRSRTSHPATQFYRPEGLNPQHHHCEKFRSQKWFHLHNLSKKYNSHQGTPQKVISGHTHTHTHHIREEICEVVLGKNLSVTWTVITPSDMWSSLPAVTSFNITVKQAAPQWHHWTAHSNSQHPSDITVQHIQTVSTPVTSLNSTLKL